jgi:hypothetical protein
MSAEDLLLERKIDCAYEALLLAPTPDLQRAYFARMKTLIATRSAQQVEHMERDKGLRA